MFVDPNFQSASLSFFDHNFVPINFLSVVVIMIMYEFELVLMDGGFP